MRILTFAGSRLACFLLFIIAISFNLTGCRQSSLNNHEDQLEADGQMYSYLIGGETVRIQKKRGEYYLSEDMLLSPQQVDHLKYLSKNQDGTLPRSIVLGQFIKRWPNGQIFYAYDSSVSSSDKQKIQSAMTNITNSTGIRFFERTNQSNYINIDKTNSSSAPANRVVSQVGLTGGAQTFRITNNQLTAGGVMHGLMHAIGVYDEHVRQDRDDYITVELANTRAPHAFSKIPSELGVPNGPFEFNSIMMEDSFYEYDPSWNLATMLRKPNNTVFTVQRDALTENDILGVKRLYTKINGPNSLCSSASQVFSLDEGLLSGATVNWTAVPSNNVIISNPSSPSTNIQAVGNGFVTLTAAISRSNSTYTVTKQIHAGQYAVSGSIFSPGPGNTSVLSGTNCLKHFSSAGGSAPGARYYETITINTPEPTSTVTWQVISKAATNTWVNLEGSNTHKMVTISPQGHHAVIRVTVSSSCGVSSSDFVFIADGTCAYDF